MADQRNGGIAWTEQTWNPIRGCTRVSAGCVNCYAETVANRFRGSGQPYEGLTTEQGRWNGKIMVVENHLEDALRWTKPRRVFVNSMSDLFHEHLSFEVVDRIFDVMERADKHTFQVLTKRADRMREYVRYRLSGKQAYADSFDKCPTEAMRNSPAAQWAREEAREIRSHIWLGVSVEDQTAADKRIPVLMDTPAAVRFLSCEPLLGPVNFGTWLRAYEGGPLKNGETCDWGHCMEPAVCGRWSETHEWLPVCAKHRGIDWVIIGGESGHGARPFDLDWARMLIDECRDLGIAVFMKQLGEHAISSNADDKRLCGDTMLPSPFRLKLSDRKGGDPMDWPDDLRVRQYPS